MYDSQVIFTLDTICPWTFIAKKRLDQAIAQVRSSPASADIRFTLHFQPYQLFPELGETVDKQSWYLHERHLDDSAAQRANEERLKALAAPLGISLQFDGVIGNTFHAHRVIQYFQEEKGEELAGRLVDALFQKYFCEGKHPAANDTLVDACVEAGIPEDEAKDVVQDKEKRERQCKMDIRVAGTDVDAVPMVSVEGRRRDITLRGAKEVEQYVDALQTIIKEST